MIEIHITCADPEFFSLEGGMMVFAQVGWGGRSEAFFFLLFVFDKFISTPPHPAPSCLDPCMFQHILDWACEKKIFPSFYSWVPLVFIKNFFYAKKGYHAGFSLAVNLPWCKNFEQFFFRSAIMVLFVYNNFIHFIQM